MNTLRWLIEYDLTTNIQHILDTASVQGINIVGVYPEALALVAEAEEKKLQIWIATLSVKRVRANAFTEEETRKEDNEIRRGVMQFWNHYLASSPQKSHLHEGLSWDHPGFLPPGRPLPGPGEDPG